MSLFRLISKKIKNEAKSAEEGMISTLMDLDFETAEEYQLEEYNRVLTKLSEQLAVASAEREKEIQEWEVAKTRRDKLISDAKKIDSKMSDGSLTLDQLPKFEEHLGKLLDEIEAMETKINEEKQEADMATEHFNMLKEAVTVAASKLATAKKTIGAKKKELERLSVAEKRAKEREKQQQVLLGLQTKTDSFGKVVDALDREITKKKEKITASQLKMEALDSHVTTVTEVDNDIASVLEDPPTKPLSLKERLASLK